MADYNRPHPSHQSPYHAHQSSSSSSSYRGPPPPQQHQHHHQQQQQQQQQHYANRSMGPMPPRGAPLPPFAPGPHTRGFSGSSQKSLLPPSHPAAQYGFAMRESKLNGGPGPELDDVYEPNGRPSRDSQYSIQSRRGRYSMSVYSDDDGPPDPSTLPQLPSQAEMQASLARSNSNGSNYAAPPRISVAARLPRLASSIYGADNPWMDTLHEEEPPGMLADDGTTVHSRSSSASSGQYDLYVPEKHGVVSPVDGTAKGIDEIIQELQNVDENDRRDSAEEEEEAMTKLPQLETRPMHGLGQFSPSSLAASSALPSIQPLSPRSPYGRGLDAADASRALGSRDPGGLNSNGSRTRSPLVPMQAFRAGEQTPPKNHGGGGGKLFLMPERQRSMKDRVGNKAPAELNMDLLREAEAHASKTSLPSLINRAFMMGNHLENGKTISKQSDWFGNDLLRDLAQKGRSTASLGQILDGFTFSPGVSQKEHDDDRSTDDDRSSTAFSRRSLAEKFNQQRSMSNARSGAFPVNDQGKPYSKYDHRHGRPYKPPRKCCGIPLWIFILLLLSAAVLLTLAIALPVVLVKNNKPGDHSCAATAPCHNGGLSITSATGSCQCMCVNQFSGPDCSIPNTSGCGSVQTSTVGSATVGGDLVDLFNKAEALYNVPLNSSSVLPMFNENNLTCILQNALVMVSKTTTKRNWNARLAALDDRDLPSDATRTVDSRAAGITPHAHRASARTLARRAADAQNGAATANGLLIAGPDGSSTTATDSSTAATPSPTGSFNANDPNTIAFAQTIIIYVAQVTNNLGVAIGAQAQLQRFFTKPGTQDPTSLSLGNGFTANLQQLNIRGQNKDAGHL